VVLTRTESTARRVLVIVLAMSPDSHGSAGCQRKQMVLDTASMTVKTTVESQLSMVGNEGDF
jgi:hypothetical protein